MAMLAVVGSSLRLSELREELSRFGDVGPMRAAIDERTLRPTERVYCVMSTKAFEDIYAASRERGFSQRIRIRAYEIRDADYPRRGYTANISIALPAGADAVRFFEELQAKLGALVKVGLLRHGTFAPSLTLEAENNQTVGRCLVRFGGGVRADAVAIARLILDQAEWQTTPDILPRCRWTPVWVSNTPPTRGHDHLDHQPRIKNTKRRRGGRNGAPRDTAAETDGANVRWNRRSADKGGDMETTNRRRQPADNTSTPSETSGASTPLTATSASLSDLLALSANEMPSGEQLSLDFTGATADSPAVLGVDGGALAPIALGVDGGAPTPIVLGVSKGAPRPPCVLGVDGGAPTPVVILPTP